MSTIKVTNIQDTSGGNQSTSAEIFEGRAKAWVKFNGTGTVAIDDDFNVSTIDDNGTGDYTVNFSNAMPNANYAVLSTGGRSTDDYNTGGDMTISQASGGLVAGSVRLNSYRHRNSASEQFNDVPNISVATFSS